LRLERVHLETSRQTLFFEVPLGSLLGAEPLHFAKPALNLIAARVIAPALASYSIVLPVVVLEDFHAVTDCSD
jgi:hypothetical protein